MGLIKCPECGMENVSDKAEKCPKCGFPIADHFGMSGTNTAISKNTQIYGGAEKKKRNPIIVVIIVVVVLAAIIGVIALAVIPNIQRSRQTGQSGTQSSVYDFSGDGVWFVEKAKDSFGDEIEGQVFLEAIATSTFTNSIGRQEELIATAGLTEYSEPTPGNLYEGFMFIVNLRQKNSLGIQDIQWMSPGTIQVKIDGKKYSYISEVSNGSYLIINSAPLAPEQSANKLIQDIYNASGDIEFAIQSTTTLYNFTIPKANFKEAFDNIGWKNAKMITSVS